MKKVILVVIATLLAFSHINANGKIEQDMLVEVTTTGNKICGVVLDKQTNESLAGVAISVGNQKVYSDLDGQFILNYTVKGQYELKISMISYEDQVLIVDLKSDVSKKVHLSQR